MNSEKLLTTSDNPYNPHEDYDLWRHWDMSNGYNTEAYIARLYDLLDLEEGNEEQLSKLLQNILDQNITGNYVLV